MATATDSQTDRKGRNAQIVVAIVVGAVLALVGVLGPVVAGREGELLVFGRNYLHDAVHFGSGAAGLFAGYYAGGRFARQYNVALGATYALVTLLGFVAAGLMVDLLAINTADNLLHLGLALVFLGVGFGLGDR